MVLLTKPASIRKCLRGIKPSRIAVAYVGEQWRDYLDMTDAEIVLSPTFGSNPRAIRELMKAFGADNVHFLDELHAKIYLGAQGALVGSCNLSRNGIGDGGREEAAIHATDAKTLRDLKTTWQRYKNMAQKQYRTRRAKEKAIEKLTRQWQLAIERGLAVDTSPAPSLMDYDLGSEVPGFHMVWYYEGEPSYNMEAIRAAIPHIAHEFDTYCEDSLSFLENDMVKEGDWLLTWNAYRNGLPQTGRNDIAWMYVHHVVSDGAREDEETKLAIEAAPLKKPNPPFRLDAATKRAIWHVLKNRSFPALHPHRDDRWELAPADNQVGGFLGAVKGELRKRKKGRETGQTKKAR